MVWPLLWMAVVVALWVAVWRGWDRTSDVLLCVVVVRVAWDGGWWAVGGAVVLAVHYLAAADAVAALRELVGAYQTERAS